MTESISANFPLLWNPRGKGGKEKGKGKGKEGGRPGGPQGRCVRKHSHWIGKAKDGWVGEVGDGLSAAPFLSATKTELSGDTNMKMKYLDQSN